MTGIKALRSIRLGRETTAGTAVAATTYWRGQGTIEDSRETVFAEEDVGYLSGVDRTYVPKLEARIEFDEVPATFEQLPHILDAGIMEATPAADGTGSGYVYTYTFSTTAQGTPQTYTIEGGDNTQAEEMEYAFVEEFSISGAPGEAIMVSATWVGRQVSLCSFTTTATIPTVEECLFQKATLFIDTAGGAFGGTIKSNTLLGFTLDVTTGYTAVYAGDGQLYFSFVKQVAPEVTLEVTFEHDAVGVAEIAAWRAQTVRRVRVKAIGSALTTASTYSTKTLLIDVCGKWESFEKIGEQDGNDIVTGTLRGRYDATATAFAVVTVVNELSALP